MADFPHADTVLARQARQRFVDETTQLLAVLPDRINEALSARDTKKSVTNIRQVMEAEMAFRQQSSAWLDTVQREWHKAQDSKPVGKTDLGVLGASGSGLSELTLIGNDEMECAVAVGQLASAIADKAGQELRDLQIRMRRLESDAALAPDDVFRPKTLAKALLDAWVGCGLTRFQWDLMQDAMRKHVAQGMREAYKRANAFLIDHGVAAEIDLRAMVRRSPDSVVTMGGGRLPNADGASSVPGTLSGGLPSTGHGLSSNYGAAVSGAGDFVYAPPGSVGRAAYELALHGGEAGGLGAGVHGMGGFVYAPPGSTGRAGYEALIHGSGVGGVGAGMGGGANLVVAGPIGTEAGNSGGGASVAMGSVTTPLGLLQQQRAQGVLGQLRQVVERQVGNAVFIGGAPVHQISPVLALALTEPMSMFPQETQGLPPEDKGKVAETKKEVGPAEVDEAVEKLKDKAEKLKDKTERLGEKAVIEIVSLMFEAILADERIPPVLRVWFGRLQVPVLRVALTEPEFFASSNYPARQLIDRMGACAMGLDSAKFDDERLEREFKRIVQVIEQYPETGKKVFQLVLKEFEQFLGSALAQDKPVQKFATLAQQLEQKDALTIQYTIELRRMLGAVPVGEDVRQFLFRVWSEVLALSAVRYGAQSAEAVRFKKAAADLLWAVSSNANCAERQQVTQHLPGILQTLREGMQTLAMKNEEQEEHICLVKQAVARALNAPGNGIAPAQMNDLARALTGLEDVVTDDPEGDLLLDPSLLEQILGVEGENLRVIAAGGVQPGTDMLQWARELQRGQWFTLRYQGVEIRVQYVWRSARGQLHLFAAASGQSYLIQTRRLASYLQAGLIAPLEDEALTIRATRAALAKLDQEPERLLH